MIDWFGWFSIRNNQIYTSIITNREDLKCKIVFWRNNNPSKNIITHKTNKNYRKFIE